MALHNRVNNKTLRAQLAQAPALDRKTLSFYKYHRIEEPGMFRDDLYQRLDALGVMGRIHVSAEGVNAQISVPTAAFDAFRESLYQIPFLRGVRLNEAVEDSGKSFFKLKILARKKIVADGLDDTSFDPSHMGEHLDAAAFNRLTDDPATILVDVRNHYESEVGRFEGAICLDIDAFRDVAPLLEQTLEGKKDKNVVMYCTGGIRCEKASAWLKHRGFKRVFQLEGGIIHYTQQTRAQGLKNKFIGKNFVFDERLGEQISPDIISRCHQCGAPCNTHVNCKNDGCHLLFIQCPACQAAWGGCCSAGCRTIAALPQEEQKRLRKGAHKGRQVFKKGRFPVAAAGGEI